MNQNPFSDLPISLDFDELIFEIEERIQRDLCIKRYFDIIGAN